MNPKKNPSMKLKMLLKKEMTKPPSTKLPTLNNLLNKTNPESMFLKKLKKKLKRLKKLSEMEMLSKLLKKLKIS